jgi:predicted AAA+ superfamily ATPase
MRQVENCPDSVYNTLMVKRTAYLDRIRSLKDGPLIKIVAGARHSGKSFLFCQIIAELKLSGIDDARIIRVDFENADAGIPRTARAIETFIGQKAEKDGKYYLFFDEIQTVSGWEKAVNALSQRRKFDIYIAVSDAACLLKNGNGANGGEKYFFINFKTFSFAEYKQIFTPCRAGHGGGLLRKAIGVKNSTDALFGNYVRYGGFPAVYAGLYGYYAALSGISGEDAKAAETCLKNIYSSILLNDVIRRAKIRNIELLEHIASVIFLNAGKENSPKKIVESLRKKRYTKDLSLVQRYTKALVNAFIIKKIPCCNLKTGRIMPANARYFVCDHGLLGAARGFCGPDFSAAAENILSHDLERREFAVYYGKINNRIVDFFAKRGDRFIFLQAVTAGCNAETLEQKTETLRFLNGIERFSSQNKYIIFLDGAASRKPAPADGIHCFSLRDFLLLEDI